MREWVVVAAVLGLLLPGGTGRAMADGSAAAVRVPPVAGVAAPYWLVADGFAPEESIEITLTAPGGDECNPADIVSGATVFTADDLGVAQAIVNPASCDGAGIPGEWLVMFQGEGGEQASASFVLGEANQIRIVPFAAPSAGGSKGEAP